MAVKKMSFLPKMGSNAKKDDAVSTETKETQNEAESATPAESESPALDGVSDNAAVNNDATDETAKASDVKTSNNKSPSPKKFFLPGKINFSPGGKKKKEPEEAALFNVACEYGSNEDCDDDMSVEVSMAAAEKGIDLDPNEDDDDDEEPKSENLPATEKKEMSALEKLRKGGDDEDIDLKELAGELKGKFTGMFRKNKSVKSAPMPEPEIGEDAEVAKSVDDADAEKTDQEMEKPVETEGSCDENAKKDSTPTAKKATFMSKFLKSSDKTAPSVPDQDEAAPDNKDDAATSEEESGDAVTVDEEVKKLPDEQPIDDAATDTAAAKTGVKSKLTKLFSKKDVSSVDEAKCDDEAKESKEEQPTEQKPEPDAASDADHKSEQKKGMKTKFMGKLGFAAAAGAVGVGVASAAQVNEDSTSKDMIADDKQPEDTNASDEGKSEEHAEETDNTEQKTKQKKEKGFKSKLMMKLGIASAAGAVGAAAVQASDGMKGNAGAADSQASDDKKGESSDSLGIIVHSGKPVSESLANGEQVSEPQAKSEGDEDSVTRDETQGGTEVMRGMSTDDRDDDSCDDRDAKHSRCGFGDDLHNALMSAGEYMYEACGDPDFGTAKKMLGLMESTEGAICGTRGGKADEKKEE